MIRMTSFFHWDAFSAGAFGFSGCGASFDQGVFGGGEGFVEPTFRRRVDGEKEIRISAQLFHYASLRAELCCHQMSFSCPPETRNSPWHRFVLQPML